HQSAAGNAVRRTDADRGHAEMGAAGDLLEPDRALLNDCPQRADQGRGARDGLSESAGAARPRDPVRGHQRVAVSQSTELSPRSDGRWARANATARAAASVASTGKPGTYEPVWSDSTPATSGPRIMPKIAISGDTPVIVPNEALPSHRRAGCRARAILARRARRACVA